MGDFLIGPLVGGIIGYITNNIAIKMLFRPLNPIYIGGKRLPFTPGMIPREQERIAKTIAQVIEKELIDPEILKSYLLSQEMCLRIEDKVYTSLKEMSQSTQTVEQFLEDLIGKKTVEHIEEALSEKITTEITKKLNESHLADPIINQLADSVKASIGPMMMFIGEGVVEGIKDKAKDMVQQFIEQKGEGMVQEMVDEQFDTVKHKPLSEVSERLMQEISKVNYVVIKSYTKIVENNLLEMLQHVRIAEIVESKIKQYEPREMEKLILAVVKKELRAIVWLGALLGALMGIIMNFF